MTLKLELRSLHGLREVCYFYMYVSYRDDFLFVFVCRFQVKEFVETIATYVTNTCDLDTQNHVMVYVTEQPDKTKSRRP